MGITIPLPEPYGMLALLIMGLGVLIATSRALFVEYQSARWPKVEAAATRAKVLEDSEGGLKMTVEYSYTVAERTYTKPVTESSDAPSITIAQYEANARLGQRLMLAYNPEAPQEATEVPGSKPAAWLALAISTGVVIYAALGYMNQRV